MSKHPLFRRTPPTPQAGRLCYVQTLGERRLGTWVQLLKSRIVKDNSPYVKSTVASHPFQTNVKPFSQTIRSIFYLERTLDPLQTNADEQKEITWPGSENPVPGDFSKSFLSELARANCKTKTDSPDPVPDEIPVTVVCNASHFNKTTLRSKL